MTPEPPACRTCRGAGYLRLPKPDGGNELVLCPCQTDVARARMLDQLLSLSGLHPAMARMTFANFETAGKPELTAALLAAQEFAASPDGWLVLFGSFGTGKTHLLAAIAFALLERNVAIYYQLVPQLLNQLRATYGSNSRLSFDDLYGRIVAAPVLLLDDLGSERLTDWASEQLTSMLDERYRAGAPTVIATNLNPGEWSGRIGSRLRDVRLVTVVGVGRTDYREGQ